MKKKLNRKYFTIDDMSGVFAISLVKQPAIEIGFQQFESIEKYEFKTIDVEKQLVIGPIMIPELWMLRKDEVTQDYFEGAFNSETIEQIAFKYLKDNNQKNNTIEHKFEVDNLCLVESWIVNDPENDKSKALGFNVPKGTWMGSIKIDNNIWDEYVKTGKVQGFSVEGYFLSEQFNKLNEQIDKETMYKIIELLNQLDN